MRDTIVNDHGEELEVDFEPGDGRRDVAVIGHGVTGNMDRPFAVALAAGLAELGIPSLRFSFAGNGGSAGRFEDATISKEVDDLLAVVRDLTDRRVFYVGHSMGAAVGVLAAAREPRIEALVSLAGMVHTAAFFARKFGTLTPGEDVMWDKPECPLSAAFRADMLAIGDVTGAARRLQIPWLLVHGDADTVVPLTDSEAIAALPGGDRTLVVLPGADHVFAAPGSMLAMVATVTGWLAER